MNSLLVRGCMSVGLILSLACSSDGELGGTVGDDDGGAPDASTAGDIGRYEPAERVDFDNVVNYGPAPTLDLPEPPKSGFRLVVPARKLQPGEEAQTCYAWAYPSIKHKNVYAARLYTTGALHHSNLYGVPYAEQGASPYPECVPGQDSIFAQVPNWLTGNIMDALFANSTQIERGEAVVFPPGMAFRVTTDGREVVTSIHWVNTTAEEMTSEIVYDFYTMPDSLVENEIVPFVFDNRAIAVPPHMTADVVGTCDVTETGNIVSFMPHTHERTTAFTVDLIDTEGAGERVYEANGFDLESDIHIFDEPIPLDGIASLQHRCTIENDLDEEIVWGVGTNEMCTLFGYLYPPEAQQIGYIAETATSCLAFNVGMNR